jgi:hypothetical protein
MKIEELPTFTVQDVQMEKGIPFQANGRFDQLKGVIEGYCDLYAPPATFIEGKLSGLQLNTRAAIFTCKNETEASLLKDGASYRYLDGYWGERARLTLDGRLIWTEHNFVPKAPGDHDHCVICWATISSVENANHMRSNADSAICGACYGNYVLPRNVDFIVPTRRTRQVDGAT